MKKIKGLLLVAILFCIKQANAQIITTVAGGGAQGFSGDGGAATAAELYLPTKVNFDLAGNMYIADFSNNRIRKVTASGIITTIAGNGSRTYSGDGVQATAAALNDPSAVAVDAVGNVYIADASNNRIRMVNTSGMISTFAGNGTLSFSGDGGQATAAGLSYPTGLAFDAQNNLFVADKENNRIRKITPSGIITTFAGSSFSQGPGGDGGQATAANFAGPDDIAFDAAGNLYIADPGNMKVRMINTAGIINTVAGNGYGAGSPFGGFSGDGGQATAAKLNSPEGVALDAAGNLYIADFMNNRIRMVTPSGIISTVAGDASSGYNGDGIQATSANLSTPWGVAIDALGNIFIADQGNNRIRMVTNNTAGINQLLTNREEIVIYPNPAKDIIRIEFKSQNEVQNVSIRIMDILGKVLKQLSTSSNLLSVNIDDLNEGVYMLEIINGNQKVIKRLIKQ